MKTRDIYLLSNLISLTGLIYFKTIIFNILFIIGLCLFMIFGIIEANKEG